MSKLRRWLLPAVLSLGWVLVTSSVVRAGLVGHWKFDGDLTDSVGGNNGTALGDAVAGTNNGIVGGAVAFDGDTDAVTISPDVIPGAPFSISFWEYSSAGTNTGYFLSSGIDGGWEDLFFRRFGADGLDYAGGITQVNGTTEGYTFGEAIRDGLTGRAPFDREEWHHHVITQDESEMGQWYIDGELELDQEVSMFEGLIEDLWLGDRLSGGRDFDGLLDDLQIYDSALSAEDALRLFENPGSAIGGAVVLQAGDADQDLDFDQLDLVQVQIAAKYLTGQPATWGEGDWNGAPGGSPGAPPEGNRLFDQQDIIAALAAGKYMTGPYGAIKPGGKTADEQTSIVYNPSTGEVAVNAPAASELTSINMDSAASIFTGDPAVNLGGSFDNDADNNIFKATFGDSFGSLSFGTVAQPDLSEQFIANDLTVVGSLAGGGDLGPVDLIYIPEPATLGMLAFGLAVFLAGRRR